MSSFTTERYISPTLCLMCGIGRRIVFVDKVSRQRLSTLCMDCGAANDEVLYQRKLEHIKNEKVRNDKMRRFENLKMWVVIVLVTLAVSSCCYWLEQDDKRMHSSFMKTCKERQVKNNEITSEEKCTKEWRQAYRETFGRNP